MGTWLALDTHVDGLVRAGGMLCEAAEKAGLDSNVPTCPAWDVRKLVAHQGMVHRWAAANLRGEKDHDTSATHADGLASADIFGWFAAGLDALVDTIRATPDDAKAMVFLRDAPPPRGFWARRQAHETTIHAVDAVSAALGRWPIAADVSIDPVFAADGIDELVTGFITRGQGKIHADRPYALLVRAVDTGHAWTVHVSDGPIVTTPEETAKPDAAFTGTAAQLYLSLWNRSDDLTITGDPTVITNWRSQIRIRWS